MMGYRFTDKLWSKPVGYCLFTYYPESKRWANLFRSHADSSDIHTWTTHDFTEEGTMLEFLQYCESTGRTDLIGSKGFEFLTQQQFFENVLG